MLNTLALKSFMSSVVFWIVQENTIKQMLKYIFLNNKMMEFVWKLSFITCLEWLNYDR